MADLREQIFRKCFQRYSGNFAGSQQANNKFDAEQIKSDEALRRQVAVEVGNLATKYMPDMVLAVPNGANWLAIDLAWILGTAIVLLNKDEATKEISYRSNGLEQIETSKRLLIVEDVPNRRTTTAKVLALPGISERAVAEVAILDRGLAEEQLAIPIPVEAVFTEPIPAILPPDSPYWEYL